MELTALIVDDERRGRELLQQLVAIHCPEIATIELAASLDDASSILNSFKPDILFLYILLGNEFGLDIISYLPQPAPAIIITTAYQEFAIKAIRVNVVDYLLKPIISEELVAAVKKVKELRSQQVLVDIPQEVIKTFPNPNKKIAISTLEGLLFITLKDILYCKAEGAYTHLYLKDAATIITSTNLGEMERTLSENAGFFRVHHAWLINIYETLKFIKGEGGYVVMSDHNNIPVSQRKRTDFLNFIKRLP